MAPKLIDLFAGCGGFTQGFVDEGFRPVHAVEWDHAAAATYAQNFGEHIEEVDIASVEPGGLPAADVLIGGPPCQGFSQLGTRDPGDPRNALWREYAEIVAAVRPKVFVLENVPRFLKSGQYELLHAMTEPGQALEEYSLVPDTLNAADFGVPQRRKRAIVIGSRVSPPVPMTPTHGERCHKPWATIAEALRGIPHEAGPTDLPDRRLDDGTPGPFKGEELHLGRNLQTISLERFKHVPPGGNRFDLPDELLAPCWVDRPTGSSDVMGRLEWDKPSLTIRTEFFKPEKGRSLHPEWHEDGPQVNRPITHWEAARLQTFPDDFKWCGSKTQIARQIGNAVPPVLAAAIARHIRGTLLD